MGVNFGRRSPTSSGDENPAPAKNKPVSAPGSPLGKMLFERGARIAEFKRRKTGLQQRQIQPDQLQTYLADGWLEGRRLKTGKIVIEKEKAHDEILEIRLWCVLYHLDATDLNEGRKFQIEVVSSGKTVKKQIDIYGRIDDVFVVAECKSCPKKQKRSLQKDIDEFASLQKPIANAVRRHYGATRQLKIIWLMATNNIIWAAQDEARAESNNIRVMQDRDLRYFEEIAKNVGPAARYQFRGISKQHEVTWAQRLSRARNQSEAWWDPCLLLCSSAK